MAGRTLSVTDALALVRERVLADDLVRAVASGRRRPTQGGAPPWRRVELRPVDLKAGQHLQVTAYDATQAFTTNHAVGDAAASEVDRLLALPFGHWHVEGAARTTQLRVTKRGEAQVSESEVAREPITEHDRSKVRLLPEDDPVLEVLGLADAQGRVKPSRRAKYRQVEEFLRLLDTTVREAAAAGHLREATEVDPLRVVDLGCGNGYLTLAAQRHLHGGLGWPVELVGVDLKAQSARHNEAAARTLGLEARFVQGTILGAEVEPAPEVVLALHACDTATDEALFRAIRWGAPVVLAAPCCHHDLAAQLRRAGAPTPYSALTADGILRERLADTLTDALRAMLLRLHGYRVDVVEFVGSEHTPRNTLIRAVRTGAPPRETLREEYAALVGTWQLRPRLAELLDG